MSSKRSSRVELNEIRVRTEVDSTDRRASRTNSNTFLENNFQIRTFINQQKNKRNNQQFLNSIVETDIKKLRLLTNKSQDSIDQIISPQSPGIKKLPQTTLISIHQPSSRSIISGKLSTITKQVNAGAEVKNNSLNTYFSSREIKVQRDLDKIQDFSKNLVDKRQAIRKIRINNLQPKDTKLVTDISRAGDVFEKSISALTEAFNTINQIIEADCKDLANLMRELWDNLLKVMKLGQKDIDIMRQDLQIKYLDEHNLIHGLHKNKFSTLQEDLHSKEQLVIENINQITQLQNTIRDAQHTTTQQREIIKKNESKLNRSVKIIQFLVKHLGNSKEDKKLRVLLKDFIQVEDVTQSIEVKQQHRLMEETVGPNQIFIHPNTPKRKPVKKFEYPKSILSRTDQSLHALSQSRGQYAKIEMLNSDAALHSLQEFTPSSPIEHRQTANKLITLTPMKQTILVNSQPDDNFKLNTPKNDKTDSHLSPLERRQSNISQNIRHLSVNSDASSSQHAEEFTDLNQFIAQREYVVEVAQKDTSIDINLLRLAFTSQECQTELEVSKELEEIFKSKELTKLATKYAKFFLEHKEDSNKSPKQQQIDDVDDTYHQEHVNKFHRRQTIQLSAEVNQKVEELDKLILQINELEANYKSQLARAEKNEIKVAALLSALSKYQSIDEFLDKPVQEASPKKKQKSKKSKEKEGNRQPALGQKITISYEYQKNQSRLLIQKINSRQVKFKQVMHLKLLLKQITLIYQDRVTNSKENKQVKEQDCSSYVYNYFLLQFGYNKVTEQKFLLLLYSVKKYLSVFRINMFAKFLGLLEASANYTVEEFQKYIEALDFISSQQNLGVNVKDNDSEPRYMMPFVRVLPYLSLLSNFHLSSEDYNQLRKDFEELKENDPINKNGVIDLDQLMCKVIFYFRQSINKTKVYVVNAFAASDLDGNGMCNLEEWLILNRHIESDRFDVNHLTSLFYDKADLEVENEKNLSFDRFAILCLENQLFTDDQQNKFLGIKNNSEVKEMFTQVRLGWEEQKRNLTQTLQEINNEESEKLFQLLEVLDKKLKEASPQNFKPLLIAEKILQQETFNLSQAEDSQSDDEDDC